MLPWLAFVLSALPANAEDAPKTAVFRATTDRVAMKFAFYSPTRRVGSVNLSEVNRWVEAAVEDNTDLDVTQLGDVIVDQCIESTGSRRRLTCLVEESSEAWMALSKALPSSYSEAKRRLRASRNHPRYVLMISAAATDGGDRLAALLIDVEDALERVHRRRSRDPQPNAEEMAALEEEISTYSVLARPPIEEQVTSSDHVQRYVQALVEEHLRQAFEAAGRWRPFGEIEVDIGVSEPFAIEIDGASVGATTGGKAKLIDVLPGERRVVLKSNEFEELVVPVRVEIGQTALVRATPIRKPNDVAFAFRQAVLWGGVASAAAGVGLMIYAAAAKGSQERQSVCFGDTDCGSTPYLRFGGSDDSPTASANGRGAPILPLGYSLLGLGSAWILGPLIDGDPERIPWIEAVVGIAVFGASFGISLALDPKEPVCIEHGTC